MSHIEKNNAELDQNSNESHFGIDELFVSRTNKQSLIQNGNNVFLRVSEYQKSQIVGRPHNLIRHPDMPKTVFKLLWSELQKDHVFCGYVKNKSKEGKFYWVVAIVFPTENGYISVRLKPSTTLKDTAENLYKEVLEHENQNGVSAGIDFFNKKIQDLGFQSYQQFMQIILKSEIFSRDEKTAHLLTQNRKHKSTVRKTSFESMFNEIQEILEAAVLEFRDSSHRTASFENLRHDCEKISNIVESVFSKLEGLSVNMSIAAHKLGKDGGALAVVASTFQNTANLLMKGFLSFQKMSAEIAKEFDSVFFSILCSRAQIEMLTFQILEVLGELKKGNLSTAEEQKEIIHELLILVQQVQILFEKNLSVQKLFFEQLIALEKNTINLKDLITKLDLIRTGGKLEGSRTSQVAESFLPFIKDMELFVRAVDQPITQILVTMTSSVETMSGLMSKVRLVKHSISEINLLFEMAKESNQEKLRSLSA